jgi:hypothetical protein
VGETTKTDGLCTPNILSMPGIINENYDEARVNGENGDHVEVVVEFINGRPRILFPNEVPAGAQRPQQIAQVGPQQLRLDVVGRPVPRNLFPAIQAADLEIERPYPRAQLPAQEERNNARNLAPPRVPQPEWHRLVDGPRTPPRPHRIIPRNRNFAPAPPPRNIPHQRRSSEDDDSDEFVTISGLERVLREVDSQADRIKIAVTTCLRLCRTIAYQLNLEQLRHDRNHDRE